MESKSPDVCVRVSVIALSHLSFAVDGVVSCFAELKYGCVALLKESFKKRSTLKHYISQPA